MRILGALVAERLSPRSVAVNQWSRLTDLSIAHGLGPILHYVLSQQDALALLPAESHAKMRAHCGQVVAANSLAHATVAHWSRRFADLGITAIWIKGAALGLTVYPDPSLRPMTDLDLLIPLEDVARAVREVEVETSAKGVHLPRDIDRHTIVRAGPGGLVRMELHWSLVDLPGVGTTEDTGWFLSQGEAYRLTDGEPLLLRPEAHLLYLCAHAEILHGESDSLLVRYFDLHRLIVCSPDMSWPTVVDKAAEFGWTFAVERALGLTHYFFATQLPDGLLEELRRRRPSTEDVTRVTRHQRANQRGQKLLNRFVGMSWSARLRLAAGLAFPSPTYMRDRYAFDAGWKVPFYYPYRWLDTATQVGKTLGKDITTRLERRLKGR